VAVIDASLYIALVNSHEADHARSWAWLERAKASHDPVCAPSILLPEVAAALSRGVGDQALAREVAEQLARSQVVELIPVSLALAERAAAVAAEHRIRGCDAVYVALAEELGDVLVTLDQQQLERGAAVVASRGPGY